MNQRPALSADKTQNIPAGIGFMVVAVFIFSLNDVLGKWLAASYAAPQILVFRSGAALLVLTPIVARAGFGTLAVVPRPRLQLVRALLATVEVGFFYAAVGYLPLADAMTYYLAGPIYVTMLAALFLGERVGWQRWSAVLVGFVGVLVALRPTSAAFGWPALIAFSGSVLYAMYMVATRSLRGTPDAVMAAWQIGVALLVGIVTAPFYWTPFRHWFDPALLCLLGVGALTGIVCVNRSLKLAPASVVVPYQYMLIIWAVLFGYLVFGDVPKWPMLIGAAIIVAAGLFIFFREQRLSLPLELDLPPER
jgi:drug/metabolite transporter (DMT)-like permease